jgi:VanZ family protein
MNNRVILAGIAGGITNFLLGYIFYVALFGEYFRTHAGTATGVGREMPEWLPLILGNIVLGFLFAMIYNWWASISTFRTGAIRGAWIGFLMTLGIDLISLGTTNVSTTSSVLVDSLIGAVIGAIVGGVVGYVLGHKGELLNTRRAR